MCADFCCVVDKTMCVGVLCCCTVRATVAVVMLLLCDASNASSAVFRIEVSAAARMRSINLMQFKREINFNLRAFVLTQFMSFENRQTVEN
jgi:hypothetical protein